MQFLAIRSNASSKRLLQAPTCDVEPLKLGLQPLLVVSRESGNILGLYGNNGKENGNYYIIVGSIFCSLD